MNRIRIELDVNTPVSEHAPGEVAVRVREIVKNMLGGAEVIVHKAEVKRIVQIGKA